MYILPLREPEPALPLLTFLAVYVNIIYMSAALNGPDFSFLDGARDADDNDLSLVSGSDAWYVNNSTFFDYARRASIFNQPDGLAKLVVRQIGTAEDNAGLDLAAGTTARAIRDLLDSGVLRHALATNYSDHRPENVVADDRLDHIAGNLTVPDTWEKIIDWTKVKAPDGLALVMHRPLAGLQSLPTKTYAGAANLMLDMIRPGGLMFTQIPRTLVAKPSELSVLCQDIRERPDIDRVHITPPRTKVTNNDERDLYAVVIKK